MWRLAVPQPLSYPASPIKGRFSKMEVQSTVRLGRGVLCVKLNTPFISSTEHISIKCILAFRVRLWAKTVGPTECNGLSLRLSSVHLYVYFFAKDSKVRVAAKQADGQQSEDEAAAEEGQDLQFKAGDRCQLMSSVVPGMHFSPRPPWCRMITSGQIRRVCEIPLEVSCRYKHLTDDSLPAMVH